MDRVQATFMQDKEFIKNINELFSNLIEKINFRMQRFEYIYMRINYEN